MKWRWMRRPGVWQVVLLCLSGCLLLVLGWRLSGRATAPPAPASSNFGPVIPVPIGPGPLPAGPETIPVSLVVSPEGGASGDQVKVELTIRDPALLKQVQHESDGRPIPVGLCWESCLTTGSSVWVGWTETTPGQFTGTLTLPRFQDGTLFQNQRLTLKAVCLAPGTGCMEQAAASAMVQMRGPTAVTTWADLSPGAWTEIPLFGHGPAPDGWVVDPNHPGRVARCMGGYTLPGNGKGPEIQSSLDGGKTWEAIPLTASLGSQASLSACRAFALDPHRSDTYYVAGRGNFMAQEYGAAPRPYVSRDSGQTWEVIPAPEGLDYPGALRGFTVGKGGVTAWYADLQRIVPPKTAALPSPFKGLFTADSGRTWTDQSFTCPEGAPCVVAQATGWRDGIYPGLLRSADGGATWRWGTWNGEVLHLVRGAFMRRGEELLAPGVCLGEDRSGGCLPLLRSTDGGESWDWVQVPAPPRGWEEQPGLWIDPDGSLRLRENTGTDQKQYQLQPGASVWTEVAQ